MCSDNCVLTMTLLSALDQSRTCRHVINSEWEWGGGLWGSGESRERRERRGGKVDLLCHHLDLGDLEMQLN